MLGGSVSNFEVNGGILNRIQLVPASLVGFPEKSGRKGGAAWGGLPLLKSGSPA